MIFFDTESIGFYGQTMLLQFTRGDDIILHHVFKHKVSETIEVIEEIVYSDVVIGFNLTHDFYHLTRLYNMCRMIENKIPNRFDFAAIDKQYKSNPSLHKDDYCLKPIKSIDLLVVSRRTEFQELLRKDPIIISKLYKKGGIPNEYELLNHLGIPPIYQPRIVIKDNEDPEFSDLHIEIKPDRGLKALAKHVLKLDTTELKTFMPKQPRNEKSYDPHSLAWMEHFTDYEMFWDIEQALNYARNDVVFTHELYNYFDTKNIEESSRDSMLSALLGSAFFTGYHVDKDKCALLNKEDEEVLSKATYNFKSPKQVRENLLSCCNSPIEKAILCSTGKKILEKVVLTSKNETLKNEVIKILALRKADMRHRITERLLDVGRLYCRFNVSGTSTNRMSGGDNSTRVKRDSINPQGIGRGELRKMFLFADEGKKLSLGDFDSFEVSIFAGIVDDPKLNEDLQSGKKFHALWGALLYEKTYEEVVKDKILYNKSKTSFFALLYGAFEDKVSDVTGVPVEQICKAIVQFRLLYPNIKKHEERVREDFTCIKNWNFYPVKKEYAETILGFRRYFKFDYSIIQRLLSFYPEFDDRIKIKRRAKEQSLALSFNSAKFGTINSIQQGIIRQIGNFLIQSVGGELTKDLQLALYDFQPTGINRNHVSVFNVHDELICVHDDILSDKIASRVKEFILENRKHVPLLDMGWQEQVSNWGDKK